VPSNTAPPAGTFSHHPVRITLPAQPASYLGVYVKGAPGSYAPVGSFAAATGVKPNIALYYSGWYEKFQSAFAVQVSDNGGVPFIQLDPEHISLAAIASGAFDTFLKTFATDVAAFGASTHRGVIIGFGHEMNGTWYPWGWTHVRPSTFVRAWRHVVHVFRTQGASNVTWMWTISRVLNRGPVRPYWPGAAYVNWVGIDGYYTYPSDTFASVFLRMMAVVHRFTHDPILLSETAIGQRAGQARRIPNLLSGVRTYGLRGLVWFDMAQHGGPFKQDWRLEGHPSAVAAFRRNLRGFV
jgi:hypothetical protein